MNLKMKAILAAISSMFLLSNPSAEPIPSATSAIAAGVVKRDKELQESTNRYCQELTTAVCSSLKESCQQSPAPNFCFHQYVFWLLGQYEYCSNTKLQNECHIEYANNLQKSQSFIKEYGETTLGALALSACLPFHKIEPKTPGSIIIQKKLTEISDGKKASLYDWKGLYECTKEQYQRILTKNE